MHALTVEEIRAQLRLATLLGHACARHGEIDGEKAHKATARALEKELDVLTGLSEK